jgi:hypothetical protein
LLPAKAFFHARPPRSGFQIASPQMSKLTSAARAALDSLNVTFSDIVLSLEPDKQSAAADVTAVAKISGDPDLDVQQLKFQLRKFGGEWLITRVQTVQILQNTGPR